MIREMISRLKAETPKFFKKVAAFGATLTALAVGLMGVASQFPAMPGGEVIGRYAGYFAVAGFVTSFVAKLTVKDTSKL